MDWRTWLLLLAAGILAALGGVGLSFVAEKHFGLGGVVADIIKLAVALVLFVALARLFGVT